MVAIKNIGAGVLIGWLALASSPPGAAAVASSGVLPNAGSAALASDGATEGAGQITQCLAEAGMSQAKPATYLVQFSRSIRPRRTTVELDAGDAAFRAGRRKVRMGKTIEVAAVSVSEIATGKVLLQAEASQRVGSKAQRRGAVMNDLCDAIRRAAPQPPLPRASPS